MSSKELLSNKLQNMSESATLAMAQKAREVRAEGHDVIALSLGQPDFDTPDHIIDAAKDAVSSGYTRYTPVAGLQELREAIVTKFKRDNGLEFTPKQISVSNGAKQNIANVCLALLDPGDETIILTPYWVSYFDIVKFAGGTPIAVKGKIDQDFKVTPEQLKAAITDKTKLLIFSSPCNPTGSVYTKDELEALAAVLEKHERITIISDEIYEYINFTGKHASIGTIPSVKDRVVTINGMSKGFAMTGWRLGYMGGPQWLINACNKVQGQFTSGANSFGQKAAAVALTSDLGPTHKMAEAYLNRKKLIQKLLGEIPGIKINNPQGAFYIFPDVSSYFGKSDGTTTIKDSFDFAEYILMNAHVAIVAGAAFGEEDCIRISYATSEDQLTEACRRIKETLSNLN